LLSDGNSAEGVLARPNTRHKNAADTIDAGFSRIHLRLTCSADHWTTIYSQKKEEFVNRGLFLQFYLADEINRSPAKVQSALLEAMQEKQVTIGSHSFELPSPFMVLATQNPIEQEGTYPLPEAQVDRFMLKVVITYPTREEEKLIVRENLAMEFPKARTIVKPEDIQKARNLAKEVYMDEKIEQYILDIVLPHDSLPSSATSVFQPD
jgi:MoxR-like ATPase